MSGAETARHRNGGAEMSLPQGNRPLSYKYDLFLQLCHPMTLVLFSVLYRDWVLYAFIVYIDTVYIV